MTFSFGVFTILMHYFVLFLRTFDQKTLSHYKKKQYTVKLHENFLFIFCRKDIWIDTFKNLFCMKQAFNSKKHIYKRYFFFGTKITAWKVFKYGVFPGPYFPVLGLNTEIYSVNLGIQSEYRKIGTRKNSVFGHFSRSEKLKKWMHLSIQHMSFLHDYLFQF